MDIKNLPQKQNKLWENNKLWPIENAIDMNPANAFITFWDTSNSGVSNSTSIQLPLINNGNYNFLVDWGDGSTDIITSWNQPTKTHDYGVSGQYEVKIFGLIKGFSFNPSSATLSDKEKILEIRQWGNVILFNPSVEFVAVGVNVVEIYLGTFEDCINLDVTATDIPDLSETTNLSDMFADCSSLVYNSSVNSWDISNITNISGMFKGANSFNQPLNNWNVSNVIDMEFMFFNNISFNQSLNNWDVSNVTNMNSMFRSSLFDQDISSWDVSNVTNMNGMFRSSPFNQSLNSWNVSNVTDMNRMFSQATNFNQDISNWDVSNVQNMRRMFDLATNFNQPLDAWDVSNVTDMSNMFSEATSFNQPLNSWDTSNVDNMRLMFRDAASFNQPLNNWNVSNVTDMRSMFENSSFDQDLSNWSVSSLVQANDFATNMSQANYDALLVGWEVNSPASGVTFSIDSSYSALSAAATARNNLVNNFNWNITDNGAV